MRLSAVFAIMLLVSTILCGPAGAGGGPLDEPPAGLLWRNDEDGGRTYQLQIDDPAEGPNVHVSLLEQLPPEVQELVPDAVDDFGVYAHPWPAAPAPTTTHGVYTVTDERGLERFPLLIVENAEPDLAAVLLEAALLAALPLLLNQAPYASNYVMPTSIVLGLAYELLAQETGVYLGGALDHPASYPRASEVYTDRPTIYLWDARKVVAGESLWQGWYLQRTGEHGGSGAYAFAERRLELGPAVRTLDETLHVGGVFLNEKNERWATPDHTYMEQRLTLGATSQGIDVPLVTVNASDERSDEYGNFQLYPQHQRTGYAIGVETPAGFVPLVGTYTEAKTDWTSVMQPGTMHERTTSVGVFVLGEYEPLVGFRYEGEWWPLEFWVLLWATTGGPGSAMVGDWQTSVGVFVQGEYEPVAGVQHRDDFPEARYAHQMMLRFGVFTLGTFHPVVGTAYDGIDPLLPGLAPTQRDWLVSSGLFLAEDYKPLFGVSFEPRVEGGSNAKQETYRVGVFPADYGTFIPLAYATWDGETSSAEWLLHAEPGLGSDGYDFQAKAGATVLGEDEDLVGLQYRHDTPSGQPYHAFLTAGVFLAGDFVPLAGVAYCSAAPGSLGLAFEAQPTLLVGVFVTGTFTPIVRVALQPGAPPVVEPAPGPEC